MKLNVQEQLKCLLWRLVSLLSAEHKFNCGKTGLGKAKKISMMMHALVARAKTAENIEAVKKMILDNCRITIREVADDVGTLFSSCQVIFTDVLGINRAAAKIVPKLLNFE